MNDEEFESEVSRMLRGRAQRYPDHPDPVGVTREDVRAAGARRRRVAGAAAAVVVTGGAVLGAQSIFSPDSSPASTFPSSTSPSTSAFSTSSSAPSSASSSPSHPQNGPTSGPSTAPEPGNIAHGCDPTVVSTAGTAAQFTWPTRGSLSTDPDLTTTLLQRSVTLTNGGRNAKLAYAGENTSTRIAIVFIDPPTDEPCGPGMQALVFHGPPGTAPSQLAVQIGHGTYNAEWGFQWAQRTSTGALDLVLIDPPTVRTLQAVGVLGTKAATATTSPTTDGTLLHSYQPGAPVPNEFDFHDQTTGATGSNVVSFVVPANTPESFAEAVGTTPTAITTPAPTRNLGPAFTIKNGRTYRLEPTTEAPGAENVYWTSY